MVAFALISASGIRLAVRDLARDEVRTFSGTDDAGYPFWSPDSRHIGFFSEGKLKRVDVTGGVPVTVCDAEVGKGGTWREDGTILFAPSYTTAIHRVSAAGGSSVAVTRLDSTQNESSHRFPRFLPDGEHFLYVVRHFSADDRGGHTLRVASLDGRVSRDLFATESDAMFANGYLFFIREGVLIAQPFDVKSLAVGGNPVKLAVGLGVMTGAAHGIFDVSPSGVMVYGQGTNASERHLLMLDADGHAQGELGQGNYDEPIHLSPDGRTLLAGIHDAIGGTSDLWLIDLARGAKTRLTFDPGHDNNALWSPDGTRVIFTAQRGSTFGPYLKPVDGGVTETRLFDNDKDLFNAGWSPDGRYLLCHELGAASNQGRLRAIALADGVSGDPLENHQMPPSLGGGLGLYRITFAPDSRWMAYESTEGERENVYAIPFGRPGQRWQITLAGGSNPRWAGKHLYFVRERRLWKIAVESRANTLVVGDETQVFNDRWVDDFDVAGDESRIIILTDDSLSGGSSLTLVLNWRELLLAQR